MDAAVYAVEAAVEETHWWFVVRRRLFAAELTRAGIGVHANILDLGSGTGSNLRMLKDLGYQRVIGFDASDEAIRFCNSKGLGPVEKGDVCALPFADESFDVVIATDILEHIDDHQRAAEEIFRVMKKGGRALITVPAFKTLWGLQDRKSFHKRRYRMKEIIAIIQYAGLVSRRRYHFNYLLFVPIYLARRAVDLIGLKLDSENQLNTPFLNRTLQALFTLDVATAPYLAPPFGVSILVLAERPLADV